MRSKTLFLILFFQQLLIFCIHPWFLQNKYVSNSWTVKDGIAHNSVLCITQDQMGYVWFGTDNGMTRFDGRNFVNFGKFNTPSLKSNSITSIFQASSGILWIGTNGGGLTIYRNHSFTYLKNNLIGNFIWAITEDKEKNIWIGTTGNGVICLKKGNIKEAEAIAGLSDDIISSIFCDSKNRIWIGTSKGLDCITNGRISKYNRDSGLGDNNISDVCEGKNGEIWVATSKGISVIAPEKIINIRKENGLTDNLVRCIRLDKNGFIWAGTDKGINKINSVRQNDEYNIKDFFNKNELSDDVILAVFAGDQGNIWLGTLFGGVNIITKRKIQLISMTHGLSNEYIKSIIEEKKDRIWIGTRGGGLNLWEKEKITVYKDPEGLCNNYIESLSCDNSGKVWIGTQRGLCQLDKGEFKVYTVSNGLVNNHILSLLNDSAGRLWIGTFGGGLQLFDDNRFTTFSQKDGLSNDFIQVIREDKKGILWIGTRDGLNKYDGNGFSVIRQSRSPQSGLIYDICPDVEDGLLISTNQGGCRWLKNNKFRMLDAENGFVDAVVYRILRDNKGDFWFGSKGGIFKIEKNVLFQFLAKKRTDLRYNNYSRDGFEIPGECVGGTQPAGWALKNGILLFPTPKGVAVIDPEKVSEKEVNFPVLVEKVLVNKKVVPLAKEIIFEPDSDEITIHFNAICFSFPKNIIIQYRLFDYDKEWKDAGDRTFVVYRDIPPGKYKFKVVGKNQNRKWDQNNDFFHFIKKPYFHQTIWFYFLIMIGCAVIVMSVMIYLGNRKKEYQVIEEKYIGSTLSKSEIAVLSKKILKYMNEDKPFLDPDLTLEKVSSDLGASKKNLSQVINEQFYKNFKNFINSFRVKLVKEKLKDPKENQFVLLKIAFECGFNSKSVFNDAFKRHTGMSPSEYRKKFQKQSQD